MHEMLFVGRGGEGVVLASQILADTFARAGFWVQSFPEFTAERRGAPISAFLRWDESSRIRRRYKIRECDVLVVVSPTPPSADVMRKVRPGGLIVLNREARFAVTGDFDVSRLPASRIAQEHGVLSSEGRPMGNVALLGACVKLLAPQALGCLEESIAARMGALADANIAAARAGYAHCLKQHALSTDTPYRARECAGRTMEPARLRRQHDRLARKPHRHLVARPAADPGRMHRVRRLRALLPRGRDHA